MAEVIESTTGGKRHAIGERWDLMPHRPLRWIARVYHYGATKYAPNNWKQLDFESEQCPVSHGIGHAHEAMEYEGGSAERCWLLAKAAWNIIAQLWWELHRPDSAAECCYQSLMEEIADGKSDLG